MSSVASIRHDMEHLTLFSPHAPETPRLDTSKLNARLMRRGDPMYMFANYNHCQSLTR